LRCIVVDYECGADYESRDVQWAKSHRVEGPRGQGRGDGLAVTPTEFGARLRCAFQRLEGEATRDGLWLTSTSTNQVDDCFQVKCVALCRLPKEAATGRTLSQLGTVGVSQQSVRFKRTELVEEYTVNLEGVRQDFVLSDKPVGEGELRLYLKVAGARVEPAMYGAQLVLTHSGRRIAYTRLRATDAKGNELPARIEVVPSGAQSELSVAVQDAHAVYPVRIDPTFSDANWVSMGGVPGVSWSVFAAAADSLGNLYLGGFFTVAGNTNANYIVKWDGTGWSPLGSGMNYGNPGAVVYALAVSGSNLYAGGIFTNAGGVLANNIAEWNGSSWLALGSGLNNYLTYGVTTLAVSGGTLFAGGDFTTAEGSQANNIAQWNGSTWSSLGSGMNSEVDALAVSDGTLYAGGAFTTAGSNGANYIAQWNGSTWSAVGSGMNNEVDVLEVSNGTLYAGGWFTTAGSSGANHIAQWNGSTWSALGTGVNNDVMLWRFRAALYMRAALSQPLAATARITLRNGTVLPGRHSVQEWKTTCMH
jgi:hypothetical protein